MKKRISKGETKPLKSMKGKISPYLHKIKHMINNLDYDRFIVVCGKERTGKSVLAGQLGWFISGGKLTIDQICMTVDDFLRALKEAKKGDVIIFDEAGINLYSREAMSTMNRMLTKAFMVSGLKNICIILCLPDFFSLDSYIRLHRIDLLMFIPKRGKFKAYSSKKSKEISLKGSKIKQIECVQATDLGWFTKAYPRTLEEAYRKKERKFKFSFLKSIKDNIEGNYNTPKFAEITGYNIKTIMRWIEDKKIKAKKIGGRWWIPKSEAERIVEEQRKSKG